MTCGGEHAQCFPVTSSSGRGQVLAGQRLASLTAREREVLELIGQGKTNRQIGEAMFLAEKTVKNYVSGLLAKLGMERRTEAAVFMARREVDHHERTHAS